MEGDIRSFLEKNRIEYSVWEKSQCSWNTLVSIRRDYIQRQAMLEKSASLYVNVIQAIQSVHSVRSRIKNPDHVIEKIIRKSAAGESKYKEIAADNYFEIITDLVGIRALHLFKEDCFDIAKSLLSTWDPVEKTIAYIRAGDTNDLTQRYSNSSMDVKEHPKGYRSLHFIFSSQPINRKVFFEVQVRTIFEEGWSEIDHTVRYPNFSDNELVSYFLAIFNRMAGSADEMGGFVKGLASSLHDYQAQILDVRNQRDEGLGRMEELLDQLEEFKKQDKDLRVTVDQLKSEVSKIRNEKSAVDYLVAVKTFIDFAGHQKKDGEKSILDVISGKNLLAGPLASNSDQGRKA
jgi:putative GTP pyrophosphokinase